MKTLSFFAPGRINLLGEHIDYNDGNVLPAPIDLGIHFSLSRREDQMVSVKSDLDGKLHLINEASIKEGTFLRYFHSVIKNRPSSIAVPEGWHFELTSTLPPGTGLSSSSALTCGFIYALLQIEGLTQEPQALIEWAVRAEHGTGVIGGSMDQTSIFFGQKDHFLSLDCSTGSKKYIPFQSTEVAFLLFDLQLPHVLVDTEYNDRRKVCERIVAMGGPSPYLAKWNLSDLDKHKQDLSESNYQMGRFVIEEEARVGSAVQALKNKDWKTLGALMSATHEGLRDQYRVSLSKIDSLQSNLVMDPDILGARIMGGGFGGCVLALVKTEGIPRVTAWAQSETKAEVYPARFANGLLQD